MLELNINGETYEFTMDFWFVKEANNTYGTEVKGAGKMRTGLRMIITNLTQLEDSETLVDVLMMANKGKKPRVKLEQINEYIGKNGMDELFDDVVNELKTSGFTSRAFKKTVEETEKAKNQNDNNSF